MVHRFNNLKCILFLSLWLISSKALAVDTYTPETGIVQLSTVSVDQNTYAVTMQHQGELVFTVTSAELTTSTSSTTNTYDANAGKLHLPSISVGTDIFDVDLTHQGELIFKVTRAELVSSEGIRIPPNDWLERFDNEMQTAVSNTHTPGMSIALVQGNETVFTKGYGLRDVANNLPVDEDTLFHIASTHKSMNSMLIATLVDNNIVDWHKPVKTYYPSFQLATDSASNSVTLSHLLSMSSGIDEAAEDLLPMDPSTQDVFLAAQNTSLLGAPSEHFSYSNISASIAGYIGVIAHNGGDDQSLYTGYAELLRKNILDPIGMTRSTIFASTAQQDNNYSKTYQLSSSGVATHETSQDVDGDALAPSGSLKSSAKEMALYIATQLNQGVAPNENRIVSAQNLAITKQVVIDNYALGWETISYKNTDVITHTGSYDGFVSVIVLVPSYSIGLVLLANSEDGAEELTEQAHEILVDTLTNSGA